MTLGCAALVNMRFGLNWLLDCLSRSRATACSHLLTLFVSFSHRISESDHSARESF